MENENSILIEEYCQYYRIQTSFVKSLHERGLIELQNRSSSYFIADDQLSLVEKYIHFHYDLDINLEGIEAISHLLNRVEALQAELRTLRGGA